MTDGAEKRGSPRHKVDWPITILADHGTLEGEAKNITGEGIFICCDEPLRLNEAFRMSILPPHHPAIGVSGKVVWSDAYCMDEDDSVFGIGVCLVEISSEDRRHLGDLLRAPGAPTSSEGG